MTLTAEEVTGRIAGLKLPHSIKEAMLKGLESTITSRRACDC